MVKHRDHINKINAVLSYVFFVFQVIPFELHQLTVYSKCIYIKSEIKVFLRCVFLDSMWRDKLHLALYHLEYIGQDGACPSAGYPEQGPLNRLWLELRVLT